MSLHLCFIAESGTDVRLVEGLAERFDLTILARKINGGVEINHPTSMPMTVIVGPSSRPRFAQFTGTHLWKCRKQIDFILVQGYSMAALMANVLRRVLRIPTAMLVCSPVEAYYQCQRLHPGPGKRFRRSELWGLRMLARINATIGSQYIVLSHYLADVIRGHGSGARIEIIPVYGVDTSIFSPPKEAKAVIKARLGLPPTGSLIFFSSRIAPEKDGETLLAAMRLLVKSGRDIWLLHRSGGYQAFVKGAERFGINERVIATDAVHPHRQLPQDYQACDLCVQASREEGLGFSPLEALACGVPVIATAVGGLKETILDGHTGWTYPVGDPKALAKCIEVVIDNPLEASRRAATGRSLVCANYDREVVFEQLAKIVRLSGGSGSKSRFFGGAMSNLDESLQEGHYAKKQILCKDWLISWSHRSRFQMALKLAREFSGKRILDYGCGDGTFLAMLMAGSFPPSAAVGAEVHGSLAEDCRARLERPGLSFVLTEALDGPEHLGSYDAIICMEVLEHVVDADAVLDRFVYLLAPSGKLLISVPVETGLPLMIKQTVRRVAGWRGLGDYPGQAPYTWRELWASVFAGRRQHMMRPIHRDSDASAFHDHKGFNWRVLHDALVDRFYIDKILSSPVTWLPPQLGSQVWFLAQTPKQK